MFRTILISLCTGLQIYVFWRAASVPFLKRTIPRRHLIAAGIVLWAVLLLSWTLRRGSEGTWSMALEIFGMHWMALLFLCSVTLLTVDVCTAFGYLMPRQSPTLRGWALVAGVVLSLFALIQGLRPPVVQSYDVHLRNLPAEMEGGVIVALSDLHLGSTISERWLAARVSQVTEQRPDLVFLLGDIFEGHGRPERTFLPVLSGLSAPLGLWAVLGNHDFHGGRAGKIETLEEAGFQVLRNRWTEIRPGFILAGVDDLTSLRRAGRNDDFVAQALIGRPAGATVFLSHTPWDTEKAARAGVGLMLCGHTHGGQIWPLDYLIRRRYPILEGRYDIDGMPVIVSRGAGTWGPRMRLWHPGEILRITLHSYERKNPPVMNIPP
ncbi:MAG: metallophosphoesterase [Deltaproteobacteria bacterium]|nr:metallophosphoesterase [Deltaproteobacteria bacterium]